MVTNRRTVDPPPDSVRNTRIQCFAGNARTRANHWCRVRDDVADVRKNTTVVILSAVTPAIKEPLPGWVDNLNGPTGILAAGGKGVLRSVLCNGEYTAEAVPVDYAINAVIAIAWKTATTKQKRVSERKMFFPWRRGVKRARISVLHERRFWFFVSKTFRAGIRRRPTPPSPRLRHWLSRVTTIDLKSGRVCRARFRRERAAAVRTIVYVQVVTIRLVRERARKSFRRPVKSSSEVYYNIILV